MMPVDGESIALWNPSWRVIAPEFEGTGDERGFLVS